MKISQEAIVRHLHPTAHAVRVKCGQQGAMYRILTKNGQLSGIYRSEVNAWGEAFRSLHLSARELRFLEKRMTQKGSVNA